MLTTSQWNIYKLIVQLNWLNYGMCGIMKQQIKSFAIKSTSRSVLYDSISIESDHNMPRKELGAGIYNIQPIWWNSSTKSL